jgi:hypothetical protein
MHQHLLGETGIYVIEHVVAIEVTRLRGSKFLFTKRPTSSTDSPVLQCRRA